MTSRLFSVLSLVALLSSISLAEMVTVVARERPITSSQPTFSETTITLEEGDSATTLYLSNFAYLDTIIDGLIVRLDANDPNQENLPVIAGPATVRVVNFNNLNAALATLRIKRAAEAEAEGPRPTQAVVIPADGTGDREVRLESSSDLLTWHPAQPGLYTAEERKRFFRLRLLKVPEDKEHGE